MVCDLFCFLFLFSMFVGLFVVLFVVVFLLLCTLLDPASAISRLTFKSGRFVFDVMGSLAHGIVVPLEALGFADAFRRLHR